MNRTKYLIILKWIEQNLVVFRLFPAQPINIKHNANHSVTNYEETFKEARKYYEYSGGGFPELTEMIHLIAKNLKIFIINIIHIFKA